MALRDREKEVNEPGWVRFTSATCGKVGQISVGVDTVGIKELLALLETVACCDDTLPAQLETT